MTIEVAARSFAPPGGGDSQPTAAAVVVLREVVGSLDRLLAALEPEPPEGSRCPEALDLVKAHLGACRFQADNSGLLLLSRVAARSAALAERFRSGQLEWNLVGKLALEELVTVVDMILDVVELVGVDSGCRQEERISLRILASIAPQVLAEVDGMDFREIRFHQASAGKRVLRAS